MKNQTVLSAIVAFIFGHKYYANIIRTKGTTKREISSFIHSCREDAEKHRGDIESTMSYEFVETISFRSRKNYG